MRSVYATLSLWARRTTSFAELLVFGGSDREGPLSVPPAGDLIYRLKQWPRLGAGHRTAGVYRALSVMSNRPVNRAWLLKNARLSPAEVDLLLERLVEQGAVEVIDSSRFESAAR